MSSDENPSNKNEEATLPKSTIISFVKEVLLPFNLKCEKAIFDIVEKISLKYISYISKESSDHCIEKGKKTLNVDHVIEALKKLKFDDHLKKIIEDLKTTPEEQEDEKNKEIVENSMEMKDLINKKKEKNKEKETKV